MDKEFEKALKCLEKLGDRAYKRYFFTEESLEELKTPIKQALLELKSIKETKSNEALKQVTYLSAILPDWQRVNNGVDSLSLIKQALTTKSKKERAFDIILELLNKHCKIKLVDGGTYYQMQIRVMGSGYTFGMSITQEEYDLLREVLLNE